MVDHLEQRQRLLGMGAPRLADYALELEERIKELEVPVRPAPNECPYPLHYGKFGAHHSRFLAEIPAEPGYPLHVVKCEACGNITVEQPVPVA